VADLNRTTAVGVTRTPLGVTRFNFPHGIGKALIVDDYPF
jgi:hypothetical protein